MSRLRLLTHSLVSVLDQGWLSAVNLLLGLSLIHWASKDAYGLYAQLFVAGLFAVSFTESLLINPMYTLAPRRQPKARLRLLRELRWAQRQAALGLGLLFALACWLILRWQGMESALATAAAFGLYVGSSTVREFQRGSGFVQGQALQVLRLDLVYGAVVLLGVGGLVLSNTLALPAVLGIMALGNLAACSLSPRAAPQPQHARARRAALAQAWRRGRLGLPGALASWVANYSYLFITAAWLGLAATADLNASRLLLMPLSLLVLAWSKVARPQISQHLHQRAPGPLKQLLLVSFGVLLLLSAAYVILLWLGLPWLQATVLGPEYDAVDHLVLPWAAYFVLYTLHLMGAAVLLSADQYRRLLSAALSSLLVLAAALLLLLPLLGTQGAVYALIVVEIYNLILLLGWFLPDIWRRLQSAGPR